MNRFYLTLALATVAASTQVGAQTPASDLGRANGRQQDMTRQQSQQMADSMFQRLDSNHDGIVTRAEADQAAARFAAARDGGTSGGHGGGGRMQHMIERTFGTAQSITLAQFQSAALARFDAHDLNHDGTVNAAEREQAHAQRQDHQ